MNPCREEAPFAVIASVAASLRRGASGLERPWPPGTADSGFCRSRRKEARIEIRINTEPPRVGSYSSGAILNQP